MRPPPERLQGLRQQPGLILAAAWVGGSVVGAHGVYLAITEGIKAESAVVSMGPVAG